MADDITPAAVYEFIPKFGRLRDEVLFGDVWEGPELSKRDRSLITHLAFYAGWPNAVNAGRVAIEVFGDNDNGSAS